MDFQSGSESPGAGVGWIEMLADHSRADTTKDLRLIAEAGRSFIAADTGEFVVVRYADVCASLTTTRLTTQRPKQHAITLEALPAPERALKATMRAHYAKWPLFSDGEYHRRLRRHLINAADDVVDVVAQDAGERIRAVNRETGQDRFSWLHRIAEPVAVSTIAAILGVAFEEAETLVGWATLIVRELAWPVMDAERTADAVRAQTELADWLERTWSAGLPDGATRYMRALHAVSEDPSLGFDSAVAALAQTVSGAYDPLVSVLATVAIAVEPEALVSLPPAVRVDEILRLATPFRFARRFTTEPMQIDGQDVPKHCRIFLGLATANLDPQVFPEPTLMRERDKPHLAFGFGRHFCLGAQVVRACLRGVLAAMTDERRTLVAETVEYSPELSIQRFTAAEGRWQSF